MARQPIVQADPPAGAGRETQRGVLGDAERGGQVVQQHQRVPAPSAQAGGQAERVRQPPEGIRRPVEGVLVEGEYLVEARYASQGRGAGRGNQDTDVGTWEGGAQGAQGGRGHQHVAQRGEFDHQDARWRVSHHQSRRGF